MASLIAFSNNAPSDTVGEMIESGVFEKVFHKFDLDMVANLNADTIIANNWHIIRSIRFKKKVDAIIDCAKLLQKLGKDKSSIASLCNSFNLPKEINSEADIVKFWEQFDRILTNYKRLGMPYFKKDTSLLHLLLHLGFPCVKPDLIVMKVAASLGIVADKVNYNTYSPNEKKLVVTTIQRYCLQRNIKPAVLDFYFLIYGGQKYYLHYVTNRYALMT
jgi:3-methyladenine DNA glycosylase Tag